MRIFLHILFSLGLFMILFNGYSQVNYSTNFDVLNADPGEGQWDATGFGGTNTYSCDGYSMKDNCYGTASDQIVEMSNETSLGTSLGGYMTVSFDYKILDYGTSTAAASADFKELKVYSGATSTGPWTLRYTLSSHTSSSFCTTKTFAYVHPAGDVFLQFTFEHSNVSSPDVDIYFDNLSIVETCYFPSATYTKNCANGTDPDFTVDVNVTDLGAGTSVDITDGTTTLFSNVGLGSYTTPTFTNPTTIYVLNHDDLTCYSEQFFSICNICTQASVPDDECATAPLIDLTQPFVGSTNCSYTVSSGTPSVCGVSVNNDSWIRFIAGSTDVEMEYEIGDCTLDDGIQLNVFSGTCGSLTEVSGSCVNPSGELITGTWSFTGLTIGNTYYIRIDGYAGDLCDYWFTPVSGVVITPDNDLCADAMTLTCGDSDIASNILATGTDAPTACSGGGTTSAGVWYTFTGTGAQVTISTDNAGTNFDTDINIFSGTCGSLTCIGGDTDSGTGTTSEYTFTATNGTTYYIYVDGNGSAEGQFEISLTCASCSANAGSWD